MYLFLFTLKHNDFDGGKSITQAIGRGGPENLDFSKSLRSELYKQQVN
jgi:hypothetical protein